MRGLRDAALLIGLVLTSGTQVSGQAWEVFDMVSAGLPSNTVLDIVTEPDGTVWLATDWGLCRGQAGEWSIFNTSNSGIPDNGIRCLALDAENKLWIGTSVGGAAFYDGVEWQVFSTLNSPMPDDQVNTIHIDRHGWVWFGTVSGLACFTGDEWRLYSSSPESYQGLMLNGNHVLSIASRSDGLMALGTLNGGFHFLTDTAVHFFTTFNSGFFDNTQMAVYLDTVANERWLACPAGGLVRQIGDWYGGTWFQYTGLNSDLPGNALMDVIGDGSGGIWLAALTAGLVHRTPAGSFTNYRTSNSGIPSDILYCVHKAFDGSIWVGTYDGGAARFNPFASLEEVFTVSPGIVIAPSPNHGRFTVLAPDIIGPAAWEVQDALGHPIATGTTVSPDGLQVAIPDLAAGTYLLRLSSGRITTVRRFVVH